MNKDSNAGKCYLYKLDSIKINPVNAKSQTLSNQISQPYKDLSKDSPRTLYDY